jgi:solute carrier family 35 protein E1
VVAYLRLLRVRERVILSLTLTLTLTFFSAVLSASILGTIFPLSVYLTLVPIVAGVGIASAKEMSFTWTGLCAGLASNFFYQLRIVLSKKELSDDKNTLTPANFFRVLTILSAIELLPISVALEGKGNG